MINRRRDFTKLPCTPISQSPSSSGAVVKQLPTREAAASHDEPSIEELRERRLGLCGDLFTVI